MSSYESMTGNRSCPTPPASKERSNDITISGELADPSIVMAEQSSHDVVNQTRSGGDASPSDVPASKPDNKPAGGDAGENKDNAQGEHAENQTSAREQDAKTEPSNAPADNGEVGKASGSSAPVSFSWS